MRSKLYQKYEIRLSQAAIGVNRSNTQWTLTEDLRLIDLYCHSDKDWKEISEELNKPQNTTCHRIQYLAKLASIANELKPSFKITGRQDNENSCKYSNDCVHCPYPACVFDGYRPNFKPSGKNRWSTGEWSSEEVLTLKRLYRVYDINILSNILNRSALDILNQIPLLATK